MRANLKESTTSKCAMQAEQNRTEGVWQAAPANSVSRREEAGRVSAEVRGAGCDRRGLCSQFSLGRSHQFTMSLPLSVCMHSIEWGKKDSFFWLPTHFAFIPANTLVVRS